MRQEWSLTDNTSAKGGYLQLCRDGKRVCDFFPFAKDADEAWVREQAKVITDAMNAASLLMDIDAIADGQHR